MPRKKEKIIEQVFEADFIKEDKPSPLLENLAFLKNVKFHSVVLCESKEKKRRGRRIVLLPRHMKLLINLFDEKLNSCAKERRKLEEDIEKQKNEYEKLSKVNEQLMKNMKDEPLQECKHPNQPSGYSPVFDDAIPQLRGLPVQGGSPGSGKK